MLKLKTNLIMSNCNCNITLNDVTGFSLDSSDGGFIKENEELVNSGDYHLSDGAFINVSYLLNSDNFCVSLISNANMPSIIPTGLVNDNYTSNIKPFALNVKRDGNLYMDRYFIMSKVYYDTYSLIPDWFDITKPILYLNASTGKYVYVNGEDEEIIESETHLINAIRNNPVLQGVVVNSTNFFNICNIKKCFIKMLEARLDNVLGYKKNKNRNCMNGGCDDDIDPDYKLVSDLITMLQYLIDCEEYLEAERFLRAIGNCSNLCEDYGSDCGCN